jgi:hypothetical protein
MPVSLAKPFFIDSGFVGKGLLSPALFVRSLIENKCLAENMVRA